MKPAKQEVQQGFISFQEAAKLLAITPDSIRLRQAGTHELTHVRLGGRIVLIRAELDEFIAARIAEARESGVQNKLRNHQRRLRLIS